MEGGEAEGEKGDECREVGTVWEEDMGEEGPCRGGWAEDGERGVTRSQGVHRTVTCCEIDCS